MVIDPVCKMEVEKTKAEVTSKYKGKKYYFCGLNCKRYFDEEPERFAEEPGTFTGERGDTPGR